MQNQGKNTPGSFSEIENLIICSNCETKFTGNYCPNCGQSVKEFNRPIRFFIVDFMSTMIAFDTRLLRTLTAVLFKPGKLTLDYVRGRRVQYMPPFRFYVFVSFVLFFLLSLVTTKGLKNNDDFNIVGNNNEVITINKDSLVNDIAQSDIHSYNDEKDKNEELKNKLQKIAKYPELYTEKLLKYGSWSLFIIMPIFAALLWVFFRRSKAYYIHHFIFSVNIHSFSFTLISIILIVHLILGAEAWSVTSWFTLLIPVYQIVGARKLYRNSYRRTFAKFLVLWMLYLFIWLIALTALVAITFQAL